MRLSKIFTVAVVVLALWIIFPAIMGYTFLFFDRNLWQPTLIASSAMIAVVQSITIATRRRFQREIVVGFLSFMVTAGLYAILAAPPADPLSLVNIVDEGFPTLICTFVGLQVIDLMWRRRRR